ncbi:sulfatase-like hydrolase/transferase [Lentisphaera marina]|uniref:sulfatase-like hydrolase/transferase n=1 Tax=Lentisphaera marina TaxID=1111041 RepID=UPI002365914A|nr:sulfatase-like hydrolase/transferase [Lentisphaera marina]MDD7985559.1 sulfatase-like hydrolase/transferase [Lentisphaera marina]
MKWIISFLVVTLSLAAQKKMNVVLLTVDDMNADSLGAFACPVEGTSPQFDAFAADAMRFNYAHVHATSCIPSRNIISSGKYLYNSGLEGFYQLPEDEVTFRTLPEVLQDNGYFTMIRGKAHHSYPYVPYKRAFDIIFDDELKAKKLNIRQPKTFYDYTKKGVEAAKKAGKPFFYSMDIHDPHTPYYGLIGSVPNFL